VAPACAGLVIAHGGEHVLVDSPRFVELRRGASTGCWSLSGWASGASLPLTKFHVFTANEVVIDSELVFPTGRLFVVRVEDHVAGFRLFSLTELLGRRHWSGW
jgi:hypothetical protein